MSILKKAALTVQFAGGVDTKTDHKQVAHVKLLDLQNAVFTRRTTLSKRNGYRSLSRFVDGQGPEYQDAVGLAARGDELIVFDGRHALSYRESTDTWADTGDVASVVTESTPIARTGTQQVMPDVAVRNGIQVAAWEDSRGGVWCSVLEEATGRILLQQTQLDAAGQSPRCVYVDDVIHVLWAVPTLGRIMIAIVNTAAPEIAPTPLILTGDLSLANPVYDAESVGPGFFVGQEPAVITWMNESTADIAVAYIHASGVIGSPVTGLPSASVQPSANTGPVAVAANRFTKDTIAILTTSSAVNVWFLDAQNLGTVSRFGILGSALAESPLRLTACFGRLVTPTNPLELADAGLWWAVQLNVDQTDATEINSGMAHPSTAEFDAAETTLRGHTLLTRAFYDGPELALSSTNPIVAPTGDVYATVAYGVRFFGYAATIRLSALDGVTAGQTICVARLLPGETPASHFRGAAGAVRQTRHISSVLERDRADTDSFSRRHAFTLSYRIQLDGRDGDQFAEVGIKYTTLDFDSLASYQTAEFGRGLYLASAAPQHYDGDRWVEAGYHAAPDWGFVDNGITFDPVDPTASFLVTAGGAVPVGTHLYKIWYEDVDGQGELHRGPTSIGVLVTVASAPNQTVRISIPTYRLTNKRRVRICVARSLTNQTGAPDTIPLFRVTGIDPSVTAGANRFVVNDPTVDRITFDDALDDVELLRREPLYTNGGILSNDPASWSGDVIAGGKNRLFWRDASDPHLVRFSQERAEETALEAPTALRLQVPPEGGAIVGLAVLDEAVIVFAETAIYYFVGPGPLANPRVQTEAFTFTPPTLIPSDAGCVSPSSISVTPIGIVYQSPSGVALVSRERQVVIIGQDVEAFNGQRLVRATPLPGRHQVLMLTDDGRSLLYDYEFQQWSTFTNHEGFDAVVVNGVYHYLRRDSRVFRETPGEYADDNSHIPMLIRTAWIKMIDYLQGFQKIIHAKIIGEYKSAHRLRVQWRLDYAPALFAVDDIAVDDDFEPSLYGAGLYGAGPYGGAALPLSTVYQQQVHVNRRCQAISFQFLDLEEVGDFGAAYELSELLLTGGVLRESFLPGPARSQ